MSQLFVTADPITRGEHAAMIATAGQAWNQYENLHRDQFANNGIEKYVVVNAEGAVIARNSNASKLKELVTNATTLRHEDFLTIRDKVTEVRRRTLNGIADLEAAGLSFPVDIAEQLIGFENVNEFQEAKQEMNPNSFQNNDTVFNEFYVPNPITHQSFSVPWRQQGFDYKRSLGLTETTRQVAEKLEEMLFNGNPNIVINFNGTLNVLYGYTTHPNRGTGTISDWTLAANQDKIVDELIEQIGLMRSGQGGVALNSVVVYVANDIWNITQKDYVSTFPSKTIVERMKDIAEVKDVKPAEKLASKQVMLVEMMERTIELAKASDVISVPHVKTNPMAPQVLTTYAAMVPQIKVDSNSATGIRHLTI